MSASHQQTKVERLFAMHRTGATIVPCAWDAGTAMILAAMGFKALGISGAGIAFSLGRRDGANQVSRGETLTASQTVVNATDLPVAGDLENGFGDDPQTVAETVRQAAAIGLAGGSIEDMNGDARQSIYDFNHAVERVAAAAEAARGVQGGFLLTARAEGVLYGHATLDETIRRLQAFEAAGADMLYAPGLPNVDAIRSVCSALTKPFAILAGRGVKPYPSVAELAEAGVRQVNLGAALVRSALTTVVRGAREVQEQGTFGFEQDALAYDEIVAFMTKAPSQR
jgi:2-methylisocitrate lyase-like PEP mutase family enzyme